jgi:hypothetical protein
VHPVRGRTAVGDGDVVVQAVTLVFVSLLAAWAWRSVADWDGDDDSDIPVDDMPDVPPQLRP